MEGLDGDKPARWLIEAQDRKIAELSGRPRGRSRRSSGRKINKPNSLDLVTSVGTGVAGCSVRAIEIGRQLGGNICGRRGLLSGAIASSAGVLSSLARF